MQTNPAKEEGVNPLDFLVIGAIVSSGAIASVDAIVFAGANGFSVFSKTELLLISNIYKVLLNSSRNLVFLWSPRDTSVLAVGDLRWSSSSFLESFTPDPSLLISSNSP